jgi:hypothetical protein
MPDIFSGIGVQSDEGSEVEIVAARGASQIAIPG